MRMPVTTRILLPLLFSAGLGGAPTGFAQQAKPAAPAAAQTQLRAPQIPLRDFFRNPVRGYFQIAPDGETIAFMQPYERRMNIFVRLLLVAALLAVALFCVFGFLATFEAGPPVITWTFRILYPFAGLASLFGAVRLVRLGRVK